MEKVAPVEIFCSYAHEDEAWLRKLEAHLSLLQRQGLIDLWHDRRIVPGTNWATTIDAHLNTAAVVLLLVSADFLASDYCYGIEMKRALKRQEAGEARVISILVRPVDWQNAPFAQLQVLPTDAQPLASYPDEDRALADVAAGIRRALEELPLLAASAPRAALPRIWNIPYPRNPFFLGRDDDLERLHHHLHEGRVTALSQPQVISGLGGIGKTQLALEYAYHYHHDYQTVLWVHADNTEALVYSYVTLATLLRLPEREKMEQSHIVQAVKVWLQTHRNWLLILDNADDLALLSDFLPPTLGGHLILTTRAAATGRLAHRLEIETLPPEHGALFLLRRAGLLPPDATLEQASPQERKLAAQINQELGGLPLALDQAGAYLEETGTDLESYWQLYQQHRVTLLRQRGGLVADHPAPVATTWALSFQRVEGRNPAAADLLRLCAFLAPDAIAEEIVTTGTSLLGPILAPVAVDALRLNQAIETLRASSLVRRDPRAKALSIHRLVQAVLQDELNEVERRIWTERAMLAVNAVFPDVEHEKHSSWPQCERLLPHALLVCQRIEADQIFAQEAGRLLYQTAFYLKERARYQEAEPLYQRAVHTWQQSLGAEHLQVAAPLHRLADLYSQQGKYAEAKRLYQQALHIREMALGSDHHLVAVLIHGLAFVYREQGQYVETEDLHLRALHIQEQTLGPVHPDVANSLNGLAFLYKEQGRYIEAEPLYQRALHIWKQLLGPNHLDVSYPLNGLAHIHRERGQYTEAEAFYRQALTIREQVLGPNHPLLAAPLNGLAHLCREQRRYSEAESFCQRAIHIREQPLGLDHPHMGYALNALAHLYRDQGQYAKAEALYQRILHIWTQMLGQNYPDIAHPLNGLAYIYREQGQYTKSETFYRHALLILKQTPGPDLPLMGYSLHGLAHLYEVQGRYNEAEPLYQHALRIWKQMLGPDHIRVTETLHHLSVCQTTQGIISQEPES